MTDVPPPKKSNLTPWLIGCGILVFLVVGGIGGVGVWIYKTAIFLDPPAIAALTERILPGAEPPAGYESKFGMDLMGLRMVVIGALGPGDPGDHPDKNVFLISSGPDDQQAEIERQLRDTGAEHSGFENDDVEKIGTKVIEVGGVDVTFDVSRGTQGDGRKMLLHVGRLPPHDGRVTMLMIAGPEAQFDQTGTDAFLASIKAAAVESIAPAEQDPAKRDK